MPGSTPSHKKARRPKDVVAKSADWTLRFRHAYDNEFLGIRWKTPATVYIRPRLELMWHSRFTCPWYKIKASRITEVAVKPCRGRDDPGRLYLGISKKLRRINKVPTGASPRWHDFGYFQKWGIGNFIGTGSKFAGWKVKHMKVAP